MSDRVCYLECIDRGVSLGGLRLVGANTDDRWSAPSSADPDSALDTIDEAGDWIRARLKASAGPSKQLGTLCLDADGSVCAWARPEDASAALIRSSIEDLEEPGEEDALDAPATSALGERFPNLPLEVDFTALDSAQASDGARAAVLATPDVPARLLIDKLDTLGIRVARVESVWHRIAIAWDPNAPHRGSSRDSSRIVSSEDPICASVIVDPDRSRALWVWSRGGALITCGSMRLAHDEHGDPVMSTDALARLTTDWLGWASQLGVAPRRVVIVMPRDEDGVTSSQIGSAISEHWAGATTDLIHDEDPILTTMRAAIGVERGEDISELTNRPGRTHRSMYRWGGAALAAAAIAVGIGAYGMYARAGAINDEARSIRSSTSATITGLNPPLRTPGYPIPELEQRRVELQNRAGPVRVTPNKPIMRELETVSFVVGMPGIEIEQILMTNTSVKMTIRCDDLSLAERVNEALSTIDGSALQWRPSPDLTNRGGKIQADYTALWDTGAGT